MDGTEPTNSYLTFEGIDFTGMCRLRYDRHRPVSGGCFSGYNRLTCSIGSQNFCCPLGTGRDEFDVSGITGVQTVVFTFNTDGTNGDSGYGVSIDNIQIGTDLDCDANCIEDAIEIIGDPSLDLNLNGLLDSCEVGSPLWIRSPSTRRLYTALPPMTWLDSVNAAEQLGTRLACVHSQAENSWLMATFSGNDGWLGFSDHGREGTFIWSDTSSVNFENWAPGEPESLVADQDYAAISPHSGAWRAWFAATHKRALVETLSIDCDEDYVQDWEQISQDPSLDCNGNGLLDACELVDDPNTDCNGDGLIDLCQLPDSALDCDDNGVIDSCEMQSNSGLDCDGDGILDLCQALDPSLDWNNDNLIDSCNPPNYCSGAPNSTGAVGVMGVSGSPIIALDSVTLTASNLPPDQWSYFLMSQATASVPGFGGSQGVLCLGQPIFRFNRTSLGEIDLTSLSGNRSLPLILPHLPQGTIFWPGETWFFQLWFRDINPAITSNTTDGIEVVFR